MQALKKAEHAKQKQNSLSGIDMPEGKAAPNSLNEEFSLSPKEPVAVVRGDRDERTTIDLDTLGLEALSPPVTAKGAPSIHAEPVLPHQELPSAESGPSHGFDDLEPAHSNFVSTANLPHRPAGSVQVENETGADTSPNAMSQQLMAKIRLEQQKAAAQASQKNTAAQQKAKVVFTAKQPPRSRRALLIAGSGLIVLAMLAGAGYLYLQTMSQSASTLVGAPQPQTAPLPSPAVVPAVDMPAASMAPAPGSPAIMEAVSEPRQDSYATRSAAATTTMAATKPEASNNVAPAPQQAQATPATEAKAIQIRQTTVDNHLNPSLSKGYQFFIADDLASAQQQYQKVLQQEPNNRDALLGLAAIALNRKQAQQAGAFYVRLLELDPGDPEAIAGLTGLQSGDLSQNESRLKKILTQNPQSAPILFALGNLYAQQSRWSEAQQSYFRAFGLAQGNADYAFNLAVSLDRLNQEKLALDFYQRALTLAQNSPGNFNKVSAQSRIKELQSSAGG